MVDSFSIKNFRAFGDVKVDDCRRVNVIVGDNGSGKTALLEALFLAAGISPELIVRASNWRGFGINRMSGSQEDLHEALWSDLFHKFQANHAAVVALKGHGEQTRSVTVRLNRQGQLRAIPPSRNRPGSGVTLAPVSSPIEFKWKIQGHPDVTIRPSFEGETIVYSGVSGRNVRGAFLASNQTTSSIEVANRFSHLNRRFQATEFIDKYNHLFPTITDLSVELNAGSPSLFARVESLPERIPLGLASGGMAKMASILLAMSDMGDGIVLIDEIENGFYYKRLPAIWEALLEASRSYDCQVFTSTHSQEALRALAPLVEKNPEDFCFLRTVHQNDGSMIRRFDGQRMANAILDNVEVR